MVSFAELSGFFPGPRSEKKTVILDFEGGTIETDARLISDPVQVQELKIPPGRGQEFMRHLRTFDPNANKSCFYERKHLEHILKNFK